MSVVLFLWDQYMIGLDSPGFHDEYLPACTAVFLMLLKDKLKESRSVSRVYYVIRSEFTIKDIETIQLNVFRGPWYALVYDMPKPVLTRLVTGVIHGSHPCMIRTP